VGFGLLLNQASGVDFSRLFTAATPEKLAIAITASLIPLVGRCSR